MQIYEKFMWLSVHKSWAITWTEVHLQQEICVTSAISFLVVCWGLKQYPSTSPVLHWANPLVKRILKFYGNPACHLLGITAEPWSLGHKHSIQLTHSIPGTMFYSTLSCSNLFVYKTLGDVSTGMISERWNIGEKNTDISSSDSSPWTWHDKNSDTKHLTEIVLFKSWIFIYL